MNPTCWRNVGEGREGAVGIKGKGNTYRDVGEGERVLVL